MRRWIACLLAVFVLGFAKQARATDFADARDGFSITIEASGMPACVTYPLARFDRVECEGLDPEREAALRARAAAGTQWIGTAVFRGDSWGFRLSITRVDVLPGSMDERGDIALLRSARDAITSRLEPGALVGGDAGLDGELTTVNGMRIAHLAYTTKGDQLGVLRSIVYEIPSELGLYTVTLLADATHAHELEMVADRALPSLRVRPRPRAWSLATIVVVYVAVPFVAIWGVVFLIVRLASTRRGGTAGVAWPGLRDREGP